jgi:hypothetical protein
LLAKSKTLQFLQAKFLGSAVDGGVFEHVTAHPRVEDCRLDGSATTKVLRVMSILELPGIVTLAVQQAWVVVSLVEVFEDAGKDLRHFIRQIHLLWRTLIELVSEVGRKERR